MAAEVLEVAILSGKHPVTTKWLAVECKLPIFEAQKFLHHQSKNDYLYSFNRILNEYYWGQKMGQVYATFLVERESLEGGIRIVIVSSEELIEGETGQVYSLQKDPVIDLSIIAKINRNLMVPPRIMMPNSVFVDPTVAIKSDSGIVETTPVQAVTKSPDSFNQSTHINSKEHSTLNNDTLLEPPTNTSGGESSLSGKVAITKTLKKGPPKPTKSAPNSKKKKLIPIKKQAVDLKSKLRSDLFSADEEEGDDIKAKATTIPVDSDDEVEEESREMIGCNTHHQSFVDFSSGDEMKVGGVEDDQSAALTSPMKVDFNSTLDSNSNLVPEKPAQQQSMPYSVVPTKMKTIRVPRTFMENGYLMTEMITETVPMEQDNGDDDDGGGLSPSFQGNTSNNFVSSEIKSPEPLEASLDSSSLAVPKSTFTNKKVVEKKDTRKQGSLLSFFKPKMASSS